MFLCYSSYMSMIYQLNLFLSIFNLIYSQTIYTALIIISNPGTKFVPVNLSAQLISTTFMSSFMQCFIQCTNNVQCRIFDYEVDIPKQCRLFEGDTNTLGSIVLSSSSNSKVGTIQFSSDLFLEYNSLCSSTCHHSRYLQCSTSLLCECMPHTYWNSSISMCIPQLPILGASCQQDMNMCREDLNYICLQFNQCGPLSILSATTIMDGTTIVDSNSTIGLSGFSGIGVFGIDIDSIVIVDQNNNRIVAIWDASTTYRNISIVATEWAPGSSLQSPYDLYIDDRNGEYDLYVSDYSDARIILYSNIQNVKLPSPIVVISSGYIDGSGANHLDGPAGIQIDNNKNIFAAAYWGNIVVVWPRNSTNATTIAGHDIPENTLTGLDGPFGLEFDRYKSWLYVADSNNHRIIRYTINGTRPYIGIVVAGGYGVGIGNNQLNRPNYIRISKKTGAMYIVDSNNHRIQRWEQGASEGVTIAGNSNGIPGTNATMLNYPIGLALNANETYMYVTDWFNNRIQRFQLI
ncbi:hypothetical protein I4U23_027359 [Adineta vaga]|nr:hypothetical protein I4U23_027359 [Adineta vaga]